MLAIDLQAAFDSVWHDGLIYKLCSIGLPTYLVKLIQSYLQDRFFCVRVGSALSSLHGITAGVPQGAVLSPLLFNMYLYDLPCPNEVTIAQFADDTAVVANSYRTAAVIRKLQQAANAFTRFFHRWRIRINPSKSEACLFTRKRAPRHRPQRCITIEGQQVSWSSSIKYLGMHLDKTLTYQQHIQQKIEKGEKMIRTLYPLISRNSKLNLPLKLLLFKAIFRPAICYASPVWSMCAATHILKLQRFQNKVLKMMLGVPIQTPTLEVHELTGVELLRDFLARMSDSFIAKGLLNLNEDIVRLFQTP